MELVKLSDLPKCPECKSYMIHIVDDVYVCRFHRIYCVNGCFVGEMGQSKIVGQGDVRGFNYHDMWISTVTRLQDALQSFVDLEPDDEAGINFAIEDAKELLRRWKE